MRRILSCVTCALCVVGGPGAAGQQPPVFRGTGDAVRVFVTVTDHDGRLVTTLSQDDFELRDEGKPQPITLFDNTPQPIRLDRDARRLGQHGRATCRCCAPARRQLFARLRPGRCGARRHVRTRRRHQPSFTHDREELRRALPDDDRARCADAAVARARRGAERVRRRGRRAAGHPRAQRRQGQRSVGFRAALR